MEFTKINIDSTKPFYIDKLGNVYNQNYKKLKCSKINGSLFLSFVLNGPKRISCKESVARLVFTTHFPKQKLRKYNVFKKKQDIENPYQIDNLVKVLRTKMPIKNKLPQKHKDKKNPIKRKFFEKLSQKDLHELILLAKNEKLKNSLLAKKYSVTRETFKRNRSTLKKMKIKNISNEQVRN